MKHASTDLVVQHELDAVLNDRGLLTSPRPTVDRLKLEDHLREVLRLLHVDLGDENLRDTPRRWAESLVTMTSGYDYTDFQKLTTLFRKACSAADENCQNLVVIGGSFHTLPRPPLLPVFLQIGLRAHPGETTLSRVAETPHRDVPLPP